MDYEHQYQHPAAWCSLPSKLSVLPAFPFYTFSTSHVLLQNKASLWNEGWASDLGKQNFLATAIEKMWNWILISENPPSSLGTGGGGSKQTSVLSENRQNILIQTLEQNILASAWTSYTAGWAESDWATAAEKVTTKGPSVWWLRLLATGWESKQDISRILPPLSPIDSGSQ